MNDKDLKFTVVSSLISVVALAFIIASIFIEDSYKQAVLTVIAFIILIVQKIVEFIKIEKTRKISGVLIFILFVGIVYFLKYRLAIF